MNAIHFNPAGFANLGHHRSQLGQNYILPFQQYGISPCGIHPIGYCTTACYATYPAFTRHGCRSRNSCSGERSCSCHSCLPRSLPYLSCGCTSSDHCRCDSRLENNHVHVRVAYNRRDLYHHDTTYEVSLRLGWTNIDLYELLERREGCDVDVFVEQKDGQSWELRLVDMTELFWGVQRGDVIGLTVARRWVI